MLPGRCAGCGEPVDLALGQYTRHVEQGAVFFTRRTRWLDRATGQPHYCKPRGDR